MKSFVQFLACVVAMFALLSFIDWLSSKAADHIMSGIQDEPVCYYEIRTTYESVATKDRVYKKVFVDCNDVK